MAIVATAEYDSAAPNTARCADDRSPRSATELLRMLDDLDIDIELIAMQALFALRGGGEIDWVPTWEQLRETPKYYEYYAERCREWWQAGENGS